MKLPKLELYTRIMLGLIFGAIIGILANKFGFAVFISHYVKPLGTAFIRLITMVVVPLVFASLFVGTASLNDVRKLGRIGSKTIVYYLCTTAIAIIIGLVLANLFQPGSGISKATQEQLLANYSNEAASKIDVALKKPGMAETLLNIIPRNPIESFAAGEMLQIILFALILGIAITLIPPAKAAPVISFFDGINEAMIKLVHIIMALAPYGVFALIASIIGEFGLGILGPLFKYSLVVIVGLLIHVTLIYSLALKLLTRAKASVTRFFRGIRPAQLIAFSSSSSSATLPVTMECVEENLGVNKEITSFVLPLGATINMDGTALYQGVAAVFIAQVFGIDLTIGQQLTIVLMATLASIGAAGVPGVGMITLTMVLKQIGIPLEGIALVLGVDRILDMCRTTVNITGDAVCAVVVGHSERQVRSPNN
ncbi:MAG: dicarboxylate/amino acid:cation symporter [candidate division KSB1 bacterium]|nr:dicarboxylate/amino acid:cation symporter [candidate division KSB1 bacterium]MDZ7335795.1 dicarboxylate/amino acid:cation symporter [candidate division KSB1 bacterium]MDZ7358462.1 dicarboxylate/amino acid:cation symporter [candidate division KSB1 bacterium]MDZ7376948.1 dicarboxylate/amino acid:cation symporter [candidate division KSB1 bacterium]MDZ7402167.1 dicarboxylate/amino acid:cation symporter [candidate division KSB1 bacterium]